MAAAQFETWVDVNLQAGVRRVAVPEGFFTQDHQANKLGVRVYNGAEPVNLYGGIRWHAKLADGTTVSDDGEIIEYSNMAYAVLKSEAYACVGPIAVAIQNIDDDDKTVLAVFTGYVHETVTDQRVIPGNPVPDIDTLLEEIENLRDATTAANNIVLVQETQPENATGNKIWVQPQSDEYQVPTWEEFQALDTTADSLGESMTTAEGDIDALETRMTTAEGDIDSLETTTSDHGARLNTAEDDIDAIEGSLSNLKSAVSNAITDSYDYYEIPVSWEDGYIDASGAEKTSTSYHRSGYILLKRGQGVRLVDVKASANVSYLVTYTLEKVFSASIAVGNSSQSVRSLSYINTGDSDVYIRVSSSNTVNTVVKMTSVAMINYANAVNPDTEKQLYALEYCFYASDKSRTNNFNLSGNAVTTPIFVRAGNRLVGVTQATTSVAQLMESDQYGNVTNILSMNTGVARPFSYLAENDIYIRVGGNTTSLPIVIRQYKNVAHKISGNNFNLVMPVVTFVFDDGTEGDANSVNVFKAHGKRCSFALISTITENTRVADYLAYQADGFEILSHSTDSRSMTGYSGADIQDETYAIDCMRDSKYALENAGFDIHGWVTPSGRLKPAWVADVKKYYDYGFTLANMTAFNDAETQTPYNTRDISAYQPVRVSLQGTTLAMCKTAIDMAIANGGMVVFYGHSVQETSEDNLTIAMLDELLTYVDELGKEIMCLPCNTAMQYYYKVTHEDFIGLS